MALSYGMCPDAFKIEVNALPESTVCVDSRKLESPLRRVCVFLNENIPPTPIEKNFMRKKQHYRNYVILDTC